MSVVDALRNIHLSSFKHIHTRGSQLFYLQAQIPWHIQKFNMNKIITHKIVHEQKFLYIQG